MGLRAPTSARPDALEEMIHYLVDTPDGRIGVLDGCARDADGRPTLLLVAQGWFGRRRLGIPVAELVRVDHRRGRIVVGRGAAPLERTLPLWRLLTALSQRVLGPLRAREGDQPRARRASTAPTGSVVCAVDDGSHACSLVAVAAELARLVAAPVVVADLTRVAGGSGSAREDGPPAAEAAPGGLVADALLARSASGVALRAAPVSPPPAETLEHVVLRENARFLVISAGRDGVPPAALARTSPDSLPCPVVLVPPTAMAAEQPSDQASAGQAVAT